MASMDGHFRSPYRMEIVCTPLSFQGTSFRYSLIQLCLFLVENCNPNLNFGWTFYFIRQRRKEFRYYLFHICKSWVFNYWYTLTTDECLSTNKIVLRHPFKGFAWIFTIVDILITEEYIVYDFLIQLLCRREIYLCIYSRHLVCRMIECKVNVIKWRTASVLCYSCPWMAKRIQAGMEVWRDFLTDLADAWIYIGIEWVWCA